MEMIINVILYKINKSDEEVEDALPLGTERFTGRRWFRFIFVLFTVFHSGST